MQEIYLAGGCFWGLQRAMDQVRGVAETEAGYANGSDRAPTYEEVRANSGHAETVRVLFDEDIVSLGELIDRYFAYLTSTGVSWQATGFGSQYRHAIFVLTMLSWWKCTMRWAARKVERAYLRGCRSSPCATTLRQRAIIRRIGKSDLACATATVVHSVI